MSTSPHYWAAVAIGAVVCVVMCWGSRRHPDTVGVRAGRALAVVLAVDSTLFLAAPVLDGRASLQTLLPLSLCDVALVVTIVTLWRTTWALGVELTYFWGLAGTMQAVVTPDLTADFPSPVFIGFVVAHLGIVIAALYLVVGMRRVPRPGSVRRIFAITLGYTGFVAVVDALTGANYMYLAAPPENASLLSLLGPWPWYIPSAAVVALVLFVLLDLPFRRGRRTAAADRAGELPPSRRARPAAAPRPSDLAGPVTGGSRPSG